MFTRALLFVFALFFSAEQLWTSAHDVHRPAGGRVVQLRLEVDAPDPRNLSLGGSVLITCSTDQNQDQTGTRTRLRLVQTTLGSIQVLAYGSPGPLSFTLGPVTLEHRGLYSCEADGPNQNQDQNQDQDQDQNQDQDTTVKSDHRLIWVQDPAAAVSVQLSRVRRAHFFHGKTLMVSCALPTGGAAEWRIMSASEKDGDISECPEQQRLGDLLSCSVSSSLFPQKTRLFNLFWCESSTGLQSNVLNLTDAEIKEQNSRELLVTRFSVAPAWFLHDGNSVTFFCEVKKDDHQNSQKLHLQLLHTHMGSGNITVVLSQPATRPINYTVDSVSHEHQGVWTCWDDGSVPHVFSLPWHHFLLVQDDSAPVATVTIDVLSHNRTQFFSNERMTVGCSLPQGEYDRWSLMRVCQWTGVVEACPGAQVSGGVLSCSQRMGYPWSNWLYWCQSDPGQQSNFLNISNTVIHSVLEAPPLPVTEGDDITLRCLEKDRKTGAITAAPAFYKHRGRTISWSVVETFTLKNVTKENEGLYSCRVKTDVTTGESYITVKARPQKSD